MVTWAQTLCQNFRENQVEEDDVVILSGKWMVFCASIFQSNTVEDLGRKLRVLPSFESWQLSRN